jgi:hypothetical protein
VDEAASVDVADAEAVAADLEGATAVEAVAGAALAAVGRTGAGSAAVGAADSGVVGVAGAAPSTGSVRRAGSPPPGTAVATTVVATYGCPELSSTTCPAPSWGSSARGVPDGVEAPGDAGRAGVTGMSASTRGTAGTRGAAEGVAVPESDHAICQPRQALTSVKVSNATRARDVPIVTSRGARGGPVTRGGEAT